MVYFNEKGPKLYEDLSWKIIVVEQFCDYDIFDIYLDLINGFVIKGFPSYMEQIKKQEI